MAPERAEVKAVSGKMGAVDRLIPDGLRRLLLKRTHALPLDVFRLAAGALCLAYFTRQWAIAPDFAAPDGLLDHELQARIYWFTRLSLFQPGTPLWALRAALGAAWLASLGLLAGWRPRACAALAWLVAVSLFRHNLLVMEVDDLIIHLLLVWMILLPVGRTLSPSSWGRDWRTVTVPGAVVWCVLANVCLVYLIAGPTKLGSQYWRSGFALYATLKLGVSHTRDWWQPRHLPLLSAASYAALALELVLPFLLLSPKGSRLKWLGLAGQAALHLGIVAAFGLPFVNLALLSTSVLFFRDELMDALGAAPARGAGAGLRAPARAALVLLVVLALAVTRDIPVLGTFKAPAYAALWAAGLFQDYRLFDWIDEKNYRIEYSAPLFPRTMENMLLQAYVHDVRWIYVPCRWRNSLKKSILERSVALYCRKRPAEAGTVEVWADVKRITPDDPGLARGQRKFIIKFACAGGQADILDAYDHRVPAPDCAPGGRRDPLEGAF